MARVEFSVEKKPPKKIRGKSLWTAQSQAGLVSALRLAAYNKRESLKLRCFKSNISIHIDVQLPESHNNPERQDIFWGDLDNIISGICESLQKADKQYIFICTDPTGGEPIIYDDDSQIITIHAVKTLVKDPSLAFYKVSIEEM